MRKENFLNSVFQKTDAGQIFVKKGKANLRDEYSNTPLFYACAFGSKEMVQALLRGGAKVNLKNVHRRTPLHNSWRPDIIQMLLKTGKAQIEATDILGETPLLFATAKYGISSVKAFLEAGSDVNAQNSMGETPLHLAAFWRGVEEVRLLIKYGANVHARDYNGQTPLHYARTVEIAETLIKSGADVYAVANNGILPIDVARVSGHKEVVAYLSSLTAPKKATKVTGFKGQGIQKPKDSRERE